MNNNSPSNGRIEIKIAGIADLDGIVCCHIAAFPGRGTTNMGSRWLRALYAHFVRSAEGICLVAVERGGDVVGFVAGGGPTVRSEFLRKAVFRYWYLILWKLLTSRVVRKAAIAQVLKLLRTQRIQASGVSRDSAASVASVDRWGSLVSIAVAHGHQGTGIACQILDSFVKESSERGYKVLRLTTFTHNRRAIAFYKKCGWYEVFRDNICETFQLDIVDK